MYVVCLLKKLILSKKHIISFLYVVVFASFLAGCQTSTKSQCYEVDWYEIGRSQGAQGKDLAAPDEKVAGCPLTKNPSLQDMYFNGYNAGLAYYCQAANAFEMGRSGQEFKLKSCPQEMKERFTKALTRGRKALELERNSQSLKQKINAAIFSLKDINLSDEQKTTIKLDLSKLKVQDQKLQQELSKVIEAI